MSDFVLRGGTLVFADREPEKQDVLVKGGKIEKLLAPGAPAPGVAEQSATGLHVFPGLIDCHVHFGMGEKITEYSTETANAAQAGFTTLLGYFLNNEAYGDVFRRELEHAVARSHVDFGFHFSTANELHIKELGDYVKNYGVTSFKYFMNFKGEEGRYLGLDGTDDGFFHALLKESSRVGRPIIVCHTENIEIVNRERKRVQAAGGNTLKDWSACKPAITESEPALRAMYMAQELGARVYFPHISSRKALDVIRFWRQRFKDVIVETCPHYLTHTEDSDLGGMGKANPPFRTRDDLEAIWEAVFDGTVDLVASDHNARKKSAKDKPLWLASQGFPATASMLQVMLSEGYHKRKLPLRRICQLLAAAPASIFDLSPTKGTLNPGSDADLTLVDLNKEKVMRAADFASYAEYNLHEGWNFKGWPVKCISRGETIMEDGKVTGKGGHGKYLWRRIGQPPIPGKTS